MKIFKKIAILILPIMALSLIGGCTLKDENQTSEKATIKTKGFIWEAKKGKNYIYLTASNQPTKPNLDYLNEEMKIVLNKVDALALEINFTDKKTVKELQEKQQKELYLKDKELKDLLNKEEQKKLDEVLKTLNLKYKEVKNLSPSGFLSLVKQIESEKAGLTGTTLTTFLAQKFSEEKKQIVSLESNNTQVDLLKKSNDDLVRFINTYNENELKTITNSMKSSTEAYINGDYKYMENESKNIYIKDKSYYGKQYKNRDIKIAKKIDELAKQDKKYIVSLGTMHYFGNNNVLKNLEKMGYKVTLLNN
ncbi:TraB/GumN family protein [Paraclostridium sordellii]|uniref:TraB/GumN family protein n=1 Tax=Paraclostridium sordellii TaxID=1505 RepID=UPI001C6154A1|nr:TraB/GumN family protein [Paeniclostridium sordellii]QYE97262.1 TraB/GumN family protein [Paeniclostridium sordellii]